MRLDEGLSPTEQAELDRLELELRKLPEVIAVGFEGAGADSEVAEDAVLVVHVLVSDGGVRDLIEQQALDLGRLHLARPLQVLVAVEGQEAPAAAASGALPSSMVLPSRVRLGAVSLVDGGRAVEVTLGHGEHQAVGRGPSGSPSGAAVATLLALRQLGWSVPFDLNSGVRLVVGNTGAVLVHLTGPEGERLGVSVGESAEHAAVKATLQALNRWLDDPSRRPMALRPKVSGVSGG